MVHDSGGAGGWSVLEMGLDAKGCRSITCVPVVLQPLQTLPRLQLSDHLCFEVCCDLRSGHCPADVDCGDQPQ
jgi:hypothetical protein